MGERQQTRIHDRWAQRRVRCSSGFTFDTSTCFGTKSATSLRNRAGSSSHTLLSAARPLACHSS
jgi:hypothetical protein